MTTGGRRPSTSCERARPRHARCSACVRVRVARLVSCLCARGWWRASRAPMCGHILLRFAPTAVAPCKVCSGLCPSRQPSMSSACSVQCHHAAALCPTGRQPCSSSTTRTSTERCCILALGLILAVSPSLLGVTSVPHTPQAFIGADDSTHWVHDSSHWPARWTLMGCSTMRYTEDGGGMYGCTRADLCVKPRTS